MTEYSVRVTARAEIEEPFPIGYSWTRNDIRAERVRVDWDPADPSRRVSVDFYGPYILKDGKSGKDLHAISLSIVDDGPMKVLAEAIVARVIREWDVVITPREER